MADYYPLIARAIAGLDPSAPGESRRALYERARAALIAQLRSVEPPLSESEITRERLSLEEAVRKVESEAAQRARDARAPGTRRAPASAAPPASGASRRRCVPRHHPARRRGRANRRRRRRRTRQPSRPRPPSPPSTAAVAQRASAARAGRPPAAQPSRRRAAAPQPPQPQVPMQDPQLPPTRERSGAPRRGPDNSAPQAPGMRGFRDIAADADDLGRAAAQANRAARKTYANVPSPSPEFDRLEPSMENRGADPDAPYSYDESVEEAERYAPPQPSRPRARAATASRRSAPAPARCFRSRARSPIGVVLILVGAAILWGKSAGDDRERPVQAVRHGGGSAEGYLAAGASRRSPIASASRRPTRPGRAGGAARGAV